MLGKTHMVGSLAVIHVSLIGYAAYGNRDVDTGGLLSGPSEALNIFGFQFGGSLSLVEYGLILAVVSLFVLGLLRVGGGRMLAGYAGMAMACMGVLLFAFESRYSFELVCILLVFALGAVLPDIDSEDSTLGKYIKPVSRLIPHRTITHTLWIVLVLGVAVWSLESVYLLALTLGYALHILEDSFSSQGIRWLYPVPVKGRSPFTYETGGFGETVMFLSAIGVHALCAGFVIWSSVNA